MTKKQFKIGNEEVSPSWNVEILARHYNERQLKDMWEAYKNARLTSGSANQPPTDKQKEIAAYAKKTKFNMSVIAKKFNVKYHVVSCALRKVAVYAYING